MTDIKATTRVCGLIGNPVEHSLSPEIHNMLAFMSGIDTAYMTFKVMENQVDEAVKGAYALNILGMNVTVPHKQSCINCLKDIDELAEAIGAVNTLVRVQGGYKGYNTDILGLYRELCDENIDLCGKDVVILGAGGAARAITFLCVQKGAENVYVLNRTVQKASIIADAVNSHFQCDTVSALPLDGYKKIKNERYIVIQASSVGLHPNDDEVIIEDSEFYEKASVGVDIIYNPSETKFMKLMQNHGHKAFNGLKMLVYQAVSAFELWNNLSVDDSVCQNIYLNVKKILEEKNR